MLKPTFSRLFNRHTLTLAVAAASVGVATLPQISYANELTSAIVGQVYNSQGDPLQNATVMITDTRSGTRRSVQTSNTGSFNVRGLAVGGPYEIRVDGVLQQTIQSLALGDAYRLTFQTGGTTDLEEVIVYGQERLLNIAPGPSSAFDQIEIERAVALDRDIKDVFAADPRINIDAGSGSAAVNCAGKSPRFNTTTLDGVRYSDMFGLNENGYATANGMPFPYDAIEQVAVELAPFDVRYGGFSACNINAVTIRGGNEWHGKVFFEYTDDSLRGDEYEDKKYAWTPYDEKKYGFSVSGPIIEDVLFISAAYEKNEEPRALAQGYAGSGKGVERSWLSAEDYNRIKNIANTVYNYNAGGQPSDGTQEAEKTFLRLDWNINDQHSAALVYNYFEGSQDRASDFDDNEFEFSNHFYTKGDENTTYSLFFNSQWTDNFFTDIFVGYNEQKDSQVTVGDQLFGDHQIAINDREGTVYLGADDSRQGNSLNYESNYLRLNGQYLLGEHTLSFGYHREELEVFNMFVQHSRGGEYDYFDDSDDNPAYCSALTAQERFEDANCGLSGIDKFELGRPSRVYYGSGGGTNIASDAAANFTNTLNAVFVQDEFIIDSLDLTITAGLRYEWWQTDDAPRYNAAFSEANGFRNDATIDGTDLLMPRVGVTWDGLDNLSLRGGFGLYSGGNPNVWISNSYSNDGITNAQVQLKNFDSSVSVLPGVAGSIPLTGSKPGYDVPQALYDRVAAVSDADASDRYLALIDPDYEQPAEWKYAVGATYDFADGYVLDADLLYTRAQDPAYYIDVSQTCGAPTLKSTACTHRTKSGTPIYSYAVGQNNFMLTNSNQTPDSMILSLVLRKQFANGFDFLAGYAYTDAEDVSPMTSSVASSNFGNLALNRLVEPKAATSNYVVPHRFTFRLGYDANWLGEYETRFTVYGSLAEGQPQSYVMSSQDLEGNGRYGRHLLYVPTGKDDPNVVFADTFDYDAFEAWRKNEGLGTGYSKRNETFADWSYRLDLRIDQEFPVWRDIKGLAYLKVYNLPNLLNSDWGVQTDAKFYSVQVVDATLNDEGQYVFEKFTRQDVNNVLPERSLWEIRAGIQIQF